MDEQNQNNKTQQPPASSQGGQRVIQPISEPQQPPIQVNSSVDNPLGQPNQVPSTTNPITPTQQTTNQPGLVLEPTQPMSQEQSTLSNISPQASVATQQTPDNTEPVIYTDPNQMNGGERFSRSDLEKESKNKKKRNFVIVLSLCLIVLMLGAAGGFYYLYSSKDHSIYSKLSTENYSSNSYVVNFKYPSVMSKDQAVLSKLQTTSNYGPLVVYVYQNSDNQKIAEFASYLNITPFIQQTGLTPTQVTSQILAKSGTYVNLFNHANPNAFSTLYPNCDSTIINLNGQTNIICTNNIKATPTEQALVSTLVIGITQDTQYTLTLEMPNTLWQEHKQVWKEVEQSFTYQ